MTDSSTISPEKYDSYFDYAASSPPYDKALERYVTWARKYYANPSSAHDPGNDARTLLHETKKGISQRVQFQEGYLVLTSGGTEANNMVIRGVMDKYPDRRLLLGADVHASSWFAQDFYRKRVDILPVEKDGTYALSQVRKMITPQTILCSLVHGNNETGVVHKITEIGTLLAQKGVLFHCDGVQVVGHLPIQLSSIPFAFYTFSAHKFGGLRGSGGICMRQADIVPLHQGGGQEMQLRAGTENVAVHAATLTALNLALESLPDEEKRLRSLTHIFTDIIHRGISEVIVNSDPNNGIPGLISLTFTGVKGSEVVYEMNLLNYAISSGSACHSGEVQASRMITNLGMSADKALGTVRISMGRYSTEKQTKDCASTLINVINRQRRLA